MNSEVISARFTFVATGDAVELYGSAGTYPGTCLKPQFFKEGAVVPPRMLDESNASVHYCDTSFPDMPVPFETTKNVAPVFCHNDALTPLERRELCRKGAAEVIVAKQMNYRTKIDDACNMEDKTCVLIPGDTFDSIAKVLSAGVDISGFEFIYLNVPIDVLQLLLIDTAVMDLRYDTDANTSPMRSKLTPPERSVLLETAVQPSNLVGDAMCGAGPMTQAVFDELEALLESRKTEKGYSFMADTVSPVATRSTRHRTSTPSPARPSCSTTTVK